MELNFRTVAEPSYPRTPFWTAEDDPLTRARIKALQGQLEQAHRELSAAKANERGMQELFRRINIKGGRGKHRYWASRVDIKKGVVKVRDEKRQPLLSKPVKYNATNTLPRAHDPCKMRTWTSEIRR